MKNFLLLTTLLTFTCKGQSLVDRLVKKISLEKYYAADLGPTDTLRDEIKNYFEVYTGSGDTRMSVIQAMAFENTDTTATLVVTGLFSDEQCSFHKTFCFTTVPGSDSLYSANALPAVNIKDLLSKSKAPGVLKSYLPAVKKNYLSSTATLDDLLREVYSLHYKIDPSTKKLLLSLDVCDYIPTNQVTFKEKDWSVVKTDFSKQEWQYNPGKKAFVK